MIQACSGFSGRLAVMPHVFTRALCRRPGPDLAGGLTTSDLGKPDFTLACDQFDRYVTTLIECGLDVTVLEPLDGYPDAHFIEDTAVVTPDVAVIARPGAASRQGEQHSVAEALAAHMPLARIESPGALDGGDVLMIGTHFLIGVSDRTNEEGARQLGVVLESHGCTWRAVPVAEGLHFKSSVNLVGSKTLLVTEAFAGRGELAGLEQITIPSGEEYAANTLLINERLIMPAGYPQTRRMLEVLDLPTTELDTSEFRKMDGGLTCLSLRF
jgi:dimethylargininase